MTYEQTLAKALSALLDRGLRIEERHAYFTGDHPCQLGSESWNNTFRNRLRGVIDNQIALVIEKTAEAVVPQGYTTKDPDKLAQADTLWASDLLREKAQTIAEAIETAEWSGVQVTVAVDYDSNGDVACLPFDPRSCYVELDRSGAYLWPVHFWKNAFGFTCATIYLPEVTAEMDTVVKTPLPKADDFRLVAETPNPFGEVMVAVIDKKKSIIDRTKALNNLLNASLQTQSVTGEGYALPFRVWLGTESYNPDTGETMGQVPVINPATGSRDIIIPTVDDAEGAKREVIQFPSPEPGKYLVEQDNLRAAIARNASVPAFMLQFGGNAPSGDALEQAYLPYLAAKAVNERQYGPWLARIGRLSIRRKLYADSRPTVAPKLDTQFSKVSTSTASSRAEQLSKAVAAGMTLADALVEFLGFSREAVDTAQANALAASAAKADLSARDFESGLLPLDD